MVVRRSGGRELPTERFPPSSPIASGAEEGHTAPGQIFCHEVWDKIGEEGETVPQKVMNSLLAYPWSGNVRKLENVIERSVILSLGSQIELGDWLQKPGVSPRGTRVPILEELDQEHIIGVLELTV